MSTLDVNVNSVEVIPQFKISNLELIMKLCHSKVFDRIES